MTGAVQPGAPVKSRRWLWVILVASLALNALLIGVVLRGVWIARANIAMTGGSIERALPSFVASLPAERREALGRTHLTDISAELRPLRRELRRARVEANRLFLADPFDKAGFVAAQERLLAAEAKLRRAVFDVLPEVGERLTVEERRAYLRWRGHGWNRGGGFRRGDGEREPARP
jgi:uncharacterized membrane protein